MTMTNAEWCVKNKIKFQEIHVSYDAEKKEAKIIYRGKEIGRSKIYDTSFATLKAWLDMEHKEQILNEEERKYLSAVIRPFRDRVWYIRKSFAVDKAKCYIFIRFNDGSSNMDFPVLRKSDMYKDMKIGKAYKLEELGI